MQNKVPPELLKETTKCPNNFSCLNTAQCGDSIECKVDFADGENMLFLESNKTIPCPYRISSSSIEVCQCPIHFYLYEKINSIYGFFEV